MSKPKEGSYWENVGQLINTEALLLVEQQGGLYSQAFGKSLDNAVKVHWSEQKQLRLGVWLVPATHTQWNTGNPQNINNSPANGYLPCKICILGVWIDVYVCFFDVK